MALGMTYALRSLSHRVVDRGLFGLNPLESHVVICGFPRSGSTLLLLIIECCVKGARTFGSGRPAETVAQYAWRNHRLMISKRPRDIFCLSQLRDYYRKKGDRTSVKTIITIRDPRSVLTSVHSKSPENYYVSVDRWLETYNAYLEEKSRGDVRVVRFENLIQNPDVVQAELSDLVNWELSKPFSEYYSAINETRLQERLTRNLNGIRPLDSATITKWKSPSHAERMKQILDEIPDLPAYLIEMGYEHDAEWARNYKNVSCNSTT